MSQVLTSIIPSRLRAGRRKPLVYPFGGYSKDFQTLVENSFEKLGITTIWELEPF
ncbi:MAG: hypothetical protein F6K36_19240 [Symploca sp. SIO3C6]|uniref:Uncharacterized protein n=1 Tax=Symploca sp. SIO1C4 TaxID=2607765 RepID=A0A6B3NI21_9CYAN|nr:hypothetical protein [Symploca sp. SIO3C6]NER31350.1 hypothetical protein [Symploca sp. SIO1C4]